MGVQVRLSIMNGREGRLLSVKSLGPFGEGLVLLQFRLPLIPALPLPALVAPGIPVHMTYVTFLLRKCAWPIWV
jgi:hypothetical protein